ncbi:MAG: DUF547 domain-containing protein [Candidatus Omnitrophica bacterium]|nr:DUF547 domain-containing protein [Candidatus Omnitrophota bacterium]
MKDKTIKLIFGIFLSVVICYANTLSAGFVWDDLNNVVNSQRIAQSEGFKQIFLSPSDGFYRPLAYLSLKLDYFFWKYKPAGYHISNILIHFLNAIMLFLIIKALGAGEVESFLAAAHPVHTEAVAYISGRSDPIAALFILLSFYLFIKFINSFAENNNNKKFLYLGSLSLFFLALLSKEIALLFPIIIIGYVFIACNQRLSRKIRYSAPFFVLAIGFIFLRENVLTGELIFPASKQVQIIDLFKIILVYLGLVIAPINLHMQRSLEEVKFINNMPTLFIIGIFSVIAFIIFKYIKSKNMQFGLFWFILWLFPFWGLLSYSAQIAEHWLYIPLIGLTFFWGLLLTMKNNKYLRIGTVIVIILMAGVTVRQNNYWHDDIRIYKYTLKFKPNDLKLNYNLGNAYLRRNKLVQAENAYLESLRIEPDYAMALNNLGIVCERQGRIESAKRLFAAANAVAPQADYARENLLRFISTPEALADDKIAAFDQGLFQELLDKYLSDGWVNYKGLIKNPQLLDRYVAQIKNFNQLDFVRLSKQEKKAMYINAYNAFTIKAIIDHYPIESIKDIPGVWKKLKFEIAGKQYTLDQIEHKILRPIYKDPRVHFSLVCAARGCPRLNSQAFTAENMDKMLELAGKNFLNDKTRNWLDKQNNVLYLSSIFKWFKNDFGNVPKFINNYLDADVVEFIKKNNPRIKYQYDWQLNEKG